MKYRSDIDGLRSLAIIPVVLCHLGVASFAGGFVGVDVFFVISGYLIGRILLEETADGSFSLIRFYERRIRRILPALLATVLGSFALAWFLFLPDEMMLFGKTAVSALLSYSNFHFNATADYFAAPAKANPLLHTWSLAVEEQFYIAFPLLLLAWKKWSGNRKVLIGLIGLLMAVSITISAVGANARDTSAFYLPHSRAWELLAGVVLALGIIPEFRHKLLRHGASLLGIVLIAYAIASFHEGMKFPGLNAL
ncbi:MAG: acyltransferase, partial [Alphaproteobacteria bacterium]|nr:acyltransferase [Alphaproteobacteria bacterium]